MNWEQKYKELLKEHVDMMTEYSKCTQAREVIGDELTEALRLNLELTRELTEIKTAELKRLKKGNK